MAKKAMIICIVIGMAFVIAPITGWGGGPGPEHTYVVEGLIHGAGIGYQFHCKAPYTSCGYRSSVLVMIANGTDQNVAFEGALPFWHAVLHHERRYRLHYHANPKPGEPNLMALDGVERLQ